MSDPTECIQVLVVDDENVIADSLAAILNMSGFQAIAAHSGEQALEVVEHMSPDILISDVIMPGITGIETAIRVQTRFPDCRVILFSGQATTLDLLSKAGVQGKSFEILTKPVHPRNLLERLHAIRVDRVEIQCAERPL